MLGYPEEESKAADMILVDTSVWISHLREGNDHLVSLLNNGHVFCHPFIIGELACGNLSNREQILSFLSFLPQCRNVDPDEIFIFIENNKLMGKGLGYIDVCLLASSVLSDISIWTYDKRLQQAALNLGLCYEME